MKYLEEEFKILIDEGGEQTRYTISNYGRVFDTFKNTYVSQVLTGKPEYFYVNYYDNTGKRKLRRVHNLIAPAADAAGQQRRREAAAAEHALR